MHEQTSNISKLWSQSLSVVKRSTRCVCLFILLWPASESFADTAISNPLLELSAQQIATAYGDQQTYTIRRNGKKIGIHTLSFRQKQNQLTITVDSSLAVRILGIPVYRLAYVAQEQWLDNQLISATATTTENGKSNTVDWRIDNDEKAEDAIQFASNHWHPGVLTGSSVFNTLTGESSSITVTLLGVETVENNRGESITATHYQYDDDISANVWYDENGLWLMMKFKGEDGSSIQYLRQD